MSYIYRWDTTYGCPLLSVPEIHEYASCRLYMTDKMSEIVVKHHTITYLFTTQSRLLTTLRKEAFENILGKGENAGNQHFLLFPEMFSTIPKTNFNFLSCIILSSASCLNLNWAKFFFLSFGKESIDLLSTPGDNLLLMLPICRTCCFDDVG